METTDPAAYFDSNDRVLNLMNMRRGALSGQSQADQIKSVLCAKIQELRGSSLRDRIVAIDLIDPELSAYIAALESINAGIWCRNCKSVKTMGAPAGGDGVGAIASTGNAPAGTQRSDQSLEVSKLSAHLATAREELSLLAAEYGAMKVRMELLTVKLESYDARLAAVGVSGQAVEGVTAGQSEKVKIAQEHSRPQVQSRVEKIDPPRAKPRHALLDLKREDLPPAPEYDLHIEVGDLSASADSLLG